VHQLEEDKFKLVCFPLLKASEPVKRIKRRPPPNLVPEIPEIKQNSMDTPYFKRRDPNYKYPKNRGRDAKYIPLGQKSHLRGHMQVQTQDRNITET